MSGRPPHLVYVVTHAMTARLLLRGQLAFFRRRGWRVTLICSPDPALGEVADREGVDVVATPIRRDVAPLADLMSLLRLARLLRRLRPDVVNAGTPKASLLGLLAARLAGVPGRLYVLRGLRLETARGLRRLLLHGAERLTAWAAVRIVCVGHGLRRRYLELGLAPAARTTVLAAGSSNGVDVGRFTRAASNRGAIETLRRRLELPDDDRVIGFVGRMTRDKGVADLVAAFAALADERRDLRLLVIGQFEAGDPVDAATMAALTGDPRVRLAGAVADVAPYYPLMTVLALPSRREGFPNVVLEAAAAGVPTVGYAVTGTTDAIIDGVTGELVAPGDVAAFAGAMARLLDDPALRRARADAARRRAEEEFVPETIWRALEVEVRRLLPEPR